MGAGRMYSSISLPPSQEGRGKILRRGGGGRKGLQKKNDKCQNELTAWPLPSS